MLKGEGMDPGQGNVGSIPASLSSEAGFCFPLLFCPVFLESSSLTHHCQLPTCPQMMCIRPPVLFLRYHMDLSEVSFPAADCLSPCDWMSLRNFLFSTLAPFCLLNLCKFVTKLLQSPCNRGRVDNACGCRQPGRASPGTSWEMCSHSFAIRGSRWQQNGPTITFVYQSKRTRDGLLKSTLQIALKELIIYEFANENCYPCMEQFALLNEKWHGVCYVLSMLRFTVTQAAGAPRWRARNRQPNVTGLERDSDSKEGTF